MCMRFRGTIDRSDPALLDLLAAEREVIVFDNVGTASSTGTTPTTYQGLGDGAVQFIEALGLAEVDVLGLVDGRHRRAVRRARPARPG